MKRLSLFIFLLPFFLISQNEISKEKNWEILKSDNYSIEYSPEWFLSQKGDMGTLFFIFTKLESKQDVFSENVNLVTEDLSNQNIDLDKYTDLSEKQIASLITNSKIIESTRIKKEKADYHKIVYTGDQGKLKLKFVQHYFIKNEKAYVLTFTSEISKFSKYTKTAEKILNSFSIKD
jgi:hypothetical protein